jgi:acyl-CoA synthetase (AMP-forming)/AMP-acid ligase II
MPSPEFTLHDFLHNSLERDPRKLAVVDGDAEYTYEDLERESGSLGAALADAGVGKGARVGVLVEKSWEAIVAMLAASRIGAAYVNVNPLFKAPQIEYLAQDCDPEAGGASAKDGRDRLLQGREAPERRREVLRGRGRSARRRRPERGPRGL